MIFRIQFVAGAILLFQGVALGLDDKQNLRGRTSEDANEEQIDEHDHDQRRLIPLGYGYTSNNIRHSRARGNNGVGSLLGMKPYAPNGTYQQYLQQQQQQQQQQRQPPPPQPYYRPQTQFKHTKSAKSTKTSKLAKGRNQAPLAQPSKYTDRFNRPQRSSYLNAMHWQRIPGQPLFVSTTDVPIIVLDQPPNVITDNDGNIILVDGNGDEIIVKVDENGNQVVEIVPFEPEEERANFLATARPTGPTNAPTSGTPTTAPPSVSPTKKPTAQPTTSPTREPTSQPTLEPSRKPTRSPTRNPTAKPSRNPTLKPTRSPTSKPTKNPTRKPTNNPTTAAASS